MTDYIIISRAGLIYGIYSAETAELAFRAMLIEADGTDIGYGDEHVGTERDWIVRPATDYDRAVVASES